MKIIISTLSLIALIINVNLHAQAWQAQNPNFPNKTTPYDVICPNTTDAWTYGFEVDSATLYFTEVNYTLSRTTDSGETWESITFPHTEPGFFSCLSALNGDVAWVSYVDYTEGNKLLKTTDGGLNWIQLPIYVGTWINLAHLFDENKGVVMGDPDSLGFEIHTTNDGGDTWTRVDNNSIPAPLTDEFGLSGYYEVVGTEIWFETTAGRVYHSPDNGNTWSVFNGPLPTTQFLFAVDNEKIVYMGYTESPNPDGSDPISKLYRSLDNGVSWEDITPIDNGWWIYDIEPVPGTNTIVASLNAGFATGLFETRISNDRGSSWTTIDNTGLVLALDFADAQSGFAGKWQYADDLSPTLVYNYTGSPLTGLLRHTPLLNLEVTISPNPTTAKVTIDLTSNVAENYWILLNDINGKLLDKSDHVIDGHWTHDINVSSLPAGTYTLTIATQKGMRTECIIKQ